MLQEKIDKYQILLASKSPRRQELLKNLGINFEIITKTGIKENYPKNLFKEQIPVYLSQLKAKAYTDAIKSNSILITADTIVWKKNIVLGKPKNYSEAFQILQNLSNAKHTVITGITLTSQTKQISFYSSTEVFFKELTKNEIEFYLKNYKPYDKAGAYGIQEWLGYIGIEKINGSYYNVVGLPVQKLYTELCEFIEK